MTTPPHMDTTVDTYEGIIDDLRAPTRSLRRGIPDAWSAFATMSDASLRDGALSARTKELMALAISIVKRCDGCIAHHAKAVARLGAGPDEVAEAIGVALLMDGGPATVYGPRALEAYQEFVDQQPRGTAAPG